MKDHTQSIITLLSEHGPRLHATLLRITLREEVAEDLMQELFLRLYRRNSFWGASDPVGFAVRTATRLAFDWRRSQQRRIDKEVINEEPQLDSNWKHCHLVQREDINSILSAMDRLPTVWRDIIVMRYLEELPYEEIATFLNKTPHQVRALCSKAKTIQYLETRTGKSPDGKLNSPTQVTQVTILGRSKERREIVSVKDGDPLTDESEWSMPLLGDVSINDLERGILVGLNVKTKTYDVSKKFLSMSPDDGKITSTEVKPVPEVDLYKRIRDFPAEEAERLPARRFGGKSAVGFRTIETFKRKRGVHTLTRTYWIDSETRLPVQIEATSKSTDPFMGQSRWVISDIVFDEPIDEGLLSTELPEGYTVLEGK